jgi:hypothetical protein
MARLRIPREGEIGLKKLAALDDDSVRELASTLREIPPLLSPTELYSKVASKVDTIPRRDIDDIVGVLLPLHLIRERRNVSLPEIAEDVCQSMDSGDDSELRLSGEDRERFKNNLIELLNVESVRLGSKALEMLFENQRSFLGARIVTEVRPIFGPDPEDTPPGALIVHMLKITYREEGEDKEFFVALDTTDIDALRNVLDRADKKTESLKGFLEKTRVSYIDPE